MTASGRLTLAFALLMLLSWVFSLWWQNWLGLARYFTAWFTFFTMFGLSASLLEKKILPYQNPFVNQGVVLMLGLLPVAFLLLVLQKHPLWLQKRSLRLGVIVLSVPGFAYLFLLPSFSRSDKVFFSTLMALPVAVALAYFPLTLFENRQVWADSLHICWGLSLPGGLLIYYFWLWPLLVGIPQAGEFYPYINLYDWLIVLFMILYSGNVYIDYWLKQRSRSLLISWNYLVLVAAILCMWLNTNIFDTLAL